MKIFSTTFEDLLTEKYGEKGSESRNKFELIACKFYEDVMGNEDLRCERLTWLLNAIEAKEKKLSTPKVVDNMRIETINYERGVIAQMKKEIEFYDTEIMDKRTLHLVVTKRWYDAIENGKKEEYRDITDYWVKRLLGSSEYSNSVYQILLNTPFKDRSNSLLLFKDQALEPKFEWEEVMFHCGYVKEGICFIFKGIELKSPNKDWFPSENITSLGMDFDKWAETHLFITILLGARIS